MTKRFTTGTTSTMPPRSVITGEKSSAPRRILRAIALGVLGALLLGVAVAPTDAQELEPRAYTNTPIGINFLIAGYGYQAGDVVADASLPLKNAKVHIHNAVLAYARSFGILGTSAKADVIVPYGWVSGSADFRGQPVQRSVDGLADPRVRLSVNLYGAPALTLADFASYQQNFIFGMSLQVQVPLGQYEEDKLVNLGNHRWVFRPEVGLSKTFGPLTLELMPCLLFFTENADFLGDKVRKQAPIHAVQGHVVYRFAAPLWGSLDGTYYGGGKTTIDGTENDDRQSNSRLGLTLSLSTSRHTSIKVYASKAITTRIGGDYDLIGLALQGRWGGGL